MYRFLFILMLCVALAAPGVSFASDPAVSDPAGIGISVSELEKLAAEDSEDAPFYARALEDAHEILRLQESRRGVEDRLASTLNDRGVEYASVRRQVASALKNVRKTDAAALEREIGALEKKRLEYLKYLDELGRLIDDLRSLPARSEAGIAGATSSPTVSNSPMVTDQERKPAEITSDLAHGALERERSSYWQYMLARSGDLLNLYGELITATELALKDIQQGMNAMRAVVLEKRLAENLRNYQETGTESLPPPVKAMLEDNRGLSARLLEIYGRWEAIGSQRSELEQKMRDATRLSRNLDAQIRNFSRSLFLASQLFSRRELIPEFQPAMDPDAVVEELRVLRYDLSDEMENLSGDARYYLEQKYPGFLRLGEQDQIRFDRLLADRRALISAVYSQTGAQLAELIEIRQLLDGYEKLRESFSSSLKQEKFWTPSARSMDSSVFANALAQGRGLFDRIRFDAEGDVSLALALLGGFALLLGARRHLRAALGALDARIGTERDSHWLAWVAGLIYALLGMLPALGVAVLAVLVHEFLLHSSLSVGHFAAYVFLAVWAAETLVLMHAERGLDERYFRLSPHPAAWGRIRRIYRLFAVIAVFELWIQQDPSLVVEDHLGQLLLFAALLALIYSYLRLVAGLCFSNERPWTYDGGTLDHLTFSRSFLSGLYETALALLLLLCLALDFFGYYYTALVVAANIGVSVFIIDFSLAFCRCIFRTVRLAARRIKLMHRLMDRRTEGAVEVEDVSRQAHWFISLVCSSACIGLMYTFVWDDLVHLTSYFRHIGLYSAAGRTVSLWDLLVVLYAAALAFIVCLNFPGFLKMVIFRRVKLLNQYSYSVITVLNYLIVGACIIFGCHKLGLSWDRLQWLIAALSVGLGFGLQEIFANFVSGLILLFERPVRIGDVITLDGHSGKVTRIQIRATTITDFDRMEYVVPNRKLITSSLVNWTLTDTVSRIVIRVSCRQGSDSDLVRRELRRIVEECPYVLSDPKSSVFLAGFDEGLLNFQIKAFVARTEDRNPCIDHLNQEVYRSFSRQGISMSVRAVEVYLASGSGSLEAKVASYGLEEQPGAHGAGGEQTGSQKKAGTGESPA
ncbi:MAG: mechanosensitive ion channel [Succinivibrionaceae bacterium]|nr:mechanosensitive ion channel [Succinivibrionaceae bacterium]